MIAKATIGRSDRARSGRRPQRCHSEREQHRLDEQPQEADIVPAISGHHLAKHKSPDDAPLNHPRPAKLPVPTCGPTLTVVFPDARKQHLQDRPSDEAEEERGKIPRSRRGSSASSGRLGWTMRST